MSSSCVTEWVCWHAFPSKLVVSDYDAGPQNQKRSYTAGAGWVTAGSQAAASASQSDRPESDDEEDSPAVHSSTMARTDSLSETYAMSPKSEEQADDSGSTSSYSDAKLLKETTLEQMPFNGLFPREEVAVAGSSQGPETKFDPADESMTIPLGSVPASEDMNYYGPSWGGSAAIVQRTPEVYPQPPYASTPSPWYGGTSMGHAQGQLATADVSNQAWSDYRHGFGPFQAATLPGKVMTEAVPDNTGFGNMHQMAMSTPFVQTAVTAANENQQAMYQGSRMHYAHDAFQQHSQAAYTGAPHQEMYTGWL